MKNILQRHNVTIKGNSEKVMLFAHGFGCDQNAWRKITNAFANDGYWIEVNNDTY